MIDIKTSSGFEVTIDERKTLDFRFLENAVKSAKSSSDIENMEGYMNMISFLFSKKDKDRLINHVADNNDGIADFEALSKEFQEILEIAKKTNSKIKN